MKKVSFALLVAMAVFSCQKNESTDLSQEIETTPSQISGRRCASDEILQKQIAENPARAAFLEQLEEKTRNYKGRGSEMGARYNGTLYIPVVIHVVHTNEQIVTDDQIRSQIDVLNKDFTKTNTELTGSTQPYLAGYAFEKVANCDIKYVVTDIKRVKTTVSEFGTNDAVKKSSQGGSDPVDPTTKLNFWVCNLSGGYLGYAQFPGGNSATDGVVVDYQAFGTTATGYQLYSSFNLGRTATHEVGHWLNLRHIWGDRRCGTDYVDDTPFHDGSNGGCPAVGLKSACSGKPLEQWMNYMDYTDDRCMYMFSSGQKVRMDAAIDNARKGYVSTTSPTSVLR